MSEQEYIQIGGLFLAFFLPLCIEWLVTYLPYKRMKKEDNQNVLRFIQKKGDLMDEYNANKKSYKTTASETVNWEFGKTTEYDKKIMFIEDNSIEETNYIETEI